MLIFLLLSGYSSNFIVFLIAVYMVAIQYMVDCHTKGDVYTTMTLFRCIQMVVTRAVETVK